MQKLNVDYDLLTFLKMDYSVSYDALPFWRLGDACINSFKNLSYIIILIVLLSPFSFFKHGKT